MVEIFSLHIVVARVAVADMQGEPAVLTIQRCEIFFHNVLVGIAHAIKEVHVALETMTHHRLQHTQHRSETNPSPNEHNGCGLCNIEEKLPAPCFDIEDVLLADAVVEET